MNASADAYALNVIFTPKNTNYASYATTVNVTVTKATTTLSWTDGLLTNLAHNGTATYSATSTSNEGAITYSIIAGGTYAEIDENSGELSVLVPGNSVTIQAAQAESNNYNSAVSEPLVITIAAIPVNEFTGTGDWNEPTNWTGGVVPTESEPNIIVRGELVIDEDVTVGDLTIENGSTVLIVTGGTLTVTGETEYRETYGDIHVKEDGNLVFENTAAFKVKDFFLDAKLGDGTTVREGASGQVENPARMDVQGDAYFELALDPSGECSYGWYDFTVPFPVDAMTGISRYHEGNLISITYNRNYALMEYNEAARAAGGKGWKSFTGTLQPGICYTITIDDVDNVYRFKKTNEGSFNTAMAQSLHYTSGANNGNLRGWNGLGNGTLQHINLNDVEGIEYVQLYNHATNAYTAYPLNQYTYVVGSSFFVQSPEAQPTMTYATPESSSILRAPQRYGSSLSDLCVTLTQEGAAYAADRLYVGASEDAINSYEIGHDLAKMGNPTEAKVAQIWTNAYGLKLCDVEMPMVNNNAVCEIGLFAPQANQYTLAVDQAPENATLYLTYNGAIIWDLTTSPYVIDLAKGSTTGYGLHLEVNNAPQITTGVDSVDGQDVKARKVIVNDKLFIITPDGAMYDVVGKCVNF